MEDGPEVKEDLKQIRIVFVMVTFSISIMMLTFKSGRAHPGISFKHVNHAWNIASKKPLRMKSYFPRRS
jgi:hypothetical protein